MSKKVQFSFNFSSNRFYLTTFNATSLSGHPCMRLTRTPLSFCSRRIATRVNAGYDRLRGDEKCIYILSSGDSAQ